LLKVEFFLFFYFTEGQKLYLKLNTSLIDSNNYVHTAILFRNINLEWIEQNMSLVIPHSRKMSPTDNHLHLINF
jgi:hypothetical protein